MTELPYVDPNGSRLRRKFLVPVFSTGPGSWYLRTVAPRVDSTLTPLTRAWVSSVPGASLLLLTHTGARSGIRRTSPLIFFSRGRDVVIMASNYGRPKDPAWLANVRAHPEVTLTFHGRTGTYRARVTDGTERDELWAIATNYVRTYGLYEQRAQGRTIQVVVCEYAGTTPRSD